MLIILVARAIAASFGPRRRPCRGAHASDCRRDGIPDFELARRHVERVAGAVLLADGVHKSQDRSVQLLRGGEAFHIHRNGERGPRDLDWQATGEGARQR